jgi:predicted NUDIX family NTP pyrophosphohydrolase
MPRLSAGLLPYRRRRGGPEVFLVHPGGPFWARKDQHAWSIAKGEAGPQEDLLAAARREFAEETGLAIDGRLMRLTPLRQPGGKVVHAWAIEAELDASSIRSNTFALEWPPRSGKMRDFPEVDRAAWFDLVEAGRRIHKGQIPFLDELEERLRG